MNRDEILTIGAGIFLLIIHSFIIATRFYRTFPFIDIGMHFLGGFLVSMFFYVRYRSLFFSSDGIGSRGFFALFLLGGVALVGVGWEIFEWIVDSYIISGFMGDLDDTMFDFIMDISGGFVVVLWVLFRRRFFGKKNNVV
jgi:hypothetical protein